MRAVVMVLRVRSRQYWKSWLALSLLVAVAGGFVLTTASAGHRTADAFPGFAARHGYDVIVYSGHRLPQLSRLPHVTSVTPVLVTYNGAVGCASCRKPIDTRNFLVNEVPPGQLPRMMTLLSGRMPRQSDPGEVLASFTLARDNGVRIGSVLRPQLGTQAELEGAKVKPSPALRPALRVVGIVVTEGEFPSGASPHYDLFATTAYAAAFNHRVALLWTYYVRLAHGDADLAGFDGSLRPLNTYGTYDLDEAADAVQASIRPQVVGWYVLTGLAALAALAVIGQAMARQTAAERSRSACPVGARRQAPRIRAAGPAARAADRRGRGRGGGADRGARVPADAGGRGAAGRALAGPHVPRPRGRPARRAGRAGRRDRGIGLARDTPCPAAAQPAARGRRRR